MDLSPKMPDTQLLALRQAQRTRVAEMRAELEKLDADLHTLDDKQLERWAIFKLPRLDVDQNNPLDLEPLFFQPFPLRDKIRECILATPMPGDWKRSCRGEVQSEIAWWLDESCSAAEEAKYRARWCIEAAGTFGQGIMGETDWKEYGFVPGKQVMVGRPLAD